MRICLAAGRVAWRRLSGLLGLSGLSGRLGRSVRGCPGVAPRAACATVAVAHTASTASVMGVPFLRAMRERYPDVRLHMVESLSGHLGTMLSARQIDLAVLFREMPAQRWSTLPLLDERLFLIGRPDLAGMPTTASAKLSQLGELPLILPSDSHGLRAQLAAAFRRGPRLGLRQRRGRTPRDRAFWR